MARSNVLCDYAQAHKGSKPLVTPVHPLNPEYPRVHVAVAWHQYLEANAREELRDQNLLKPGTKMDAPPGQWAKELAAAMVKCGIAVHGDKGDVD